MRQKPSILVCLDVARNTDTSLRYVLNLVKKFDFSIQILVVIEPSQSMLFVSKAIGKCRRDEVETRLQKMIDSVFSETGIIPVISIREGEVSREVLKEVKENPNYAMMVFGKSGKQVENVLAKLSSQIGSKIKFPVLIVPDNLEDKYFF
ncbi:MAG: nucleotide-binding universal stress UspA family protein [Rickettsiales bacterium]|jgi:nucleotide-binding universal stress UspA family protein